MLLTLSMKMMPGSAQRCVEAMMRSQISGAKPCPVAAALRRCRCNCRLRRYWLWDRNRLVQGCRRIRLEPFVVFDRLQELVRDRDGDIEIGQALLIVFGVNETQDVRMRYGKMPIFAPRRTPPCFTTSVTVLTICINETGPEADAARFADRRASRTQQFIRHACAAARLMNQRAIFGVLHNAF